VRMPQHHVRAERHVAPDPTEQARVELRAQEQAERARQVRAQRGKERGK